jgi:hypothetical protein
MFSLVLFGKPYMKNALVSERQAMIVRCPPLLPPPSRAIRFFTTPPPRSASINPCSISATASAKVLSGTSSLRAQRLKLFALKILVTPPRHS